MNGLSVKSASEKRNTFMRGLILAQVAYLFIFYGFFLSVPVLSKLRYVTDLITLALLAGLFFDRQRLYKLKGKAYCIPLLVYTAVCIFTAVVGKTEPLLFLWAVRNTFRFFVFFFACVLYIKREDIKRFFDFLIKLQFVNLPVVIIEYIYFKPIPKAERGILADNIGGIFGTELGGNGILNIYLCLILIVVLINYYETEKFKPIHLFSIGNVMICAAFAELKVFFFEAVGIFVICSIFYIKKIIKKPLHFFKIFSYFVFSLFVCYLIMLQLYPYVERDFAGGYSGYEEKTSSVYKLGRIGAFSKINEIFFKDSLPLNLFGLGFGNCEYSSFSFLVSDFYKSYGDYNYRWFSHQMLYLETGIVGFISYALFFVATAVQALVLFHKKKKYRSICVFSIAVAAILFVTLWYNNIVRTDFGYVCYFCLAFVPFLINNDMDSIESNIMKGRS